VELLTKIVAQPLSYYLTIDLFNKYANFIIMEIFVMFTVVWSWIFM